MPGFVSALKKEVELTAPQYTASEFDSVFWGGGTPSLLSEKLIAEIWQAIFDHFKITPDAEISLEANPSAVHLEKLKWLRQTGFNRISFGVQSFNDDHLKFLGRIHTAREALQSFEDARTAGFQNINLDLMTAFDGLTLEQFEETLSTAARLAPEHLACYTLIFEPHTPFYRMLERGEIRAFSEEEEAGFFSFTRQYLEGHGYLAYETSNYARTPNFYCRHNLKYWKHRPYLGLGPSAHSFDGKRRWWNVRSLLRYNRLLGEGQLPVAESEELNEDIRKFEFIFLRLRLREGVSLAEYRQAFGRDFLEEYKEVLDRLMEQQYLSLQKDHLCLTEKGWPLADEIAQYF
ncbi:MAG: radical SAM family heme chaperone HemW [Calditrichia bacterium]